MANVVSNHKINFRLGTDARNHIADCECGWKYSGTYMDIRSAAKLHCEDNNYLGWRNPRRATQPDKKRKYVPA